MRIIIAPAKKMNIDLDSFAPEGPPRFPDRTERLKAALQAMPPTVRRLAEHNVTDPEDIESFTDLDYRYSPAHSAKNNLVFIRGDWL